MGRFLGFISFWINRPVAVFFLSCLVAFGALLFDGSLLRLWTLKVEKAKLAERLIDYRRGNSELKFKIARASKNSEFIEKQAKEKLDLVKKDELVFVFAE